MFDRRQIKPKMAVFGLPSGCPVKFRNLGKCSEGIHESLIHSITARVFQSSIPFLPPWHSVPRHTWASPEVFQNLFVQAGNTGSLAQNRTALAKCLTMGVLGSACTHCSAGFSLKTNTNYLQPSTWTQGLFSVRSWSCSVVPQCRVFQHTWILRVHGHMKRCEERE